jgi:hypothetical protein
MSADPTRCDDACAPDPFCLPERMTMLGPIPSGLVGDATTTDIGEPIAGPGFLPGKVLGSKRIPCIGRPCDRVLIEGKVLSDFLPGVIPPFLPQRPIAFPENAQSSARSVKLRAQRCKYPGWVYFDSDSHITLPGGDDIEVQAVGPANWLAIPSDGPLPFELPADVQRVEVRVRACLLTREQCFPSRLTWWSSQQDANATMLRPPRAVDLFIVISSGLAPIAANFAWQDRSAVTLAVFAINAAFVPNVVYCGAGEQLVLFSPSPVDIMYVWRIE